MNFWGMTFSSLMKEESWFVILHSSAENENPFACKYCNKKFKTSQEVKIHERIHTGEKPFACKDCDKKFTQSKRLKIHERRHSGEKPFTCKYCDKNFITSHELKIHERFHTGEKTFSCKYCDKKFKFQELFLWKDQKILSKIQG